MASVQFFNLSSDKFEKYRENIVKYINDPPELRNLPKNPEEINPYIDACIKSVIETCLEINVDVKERIPHDNRIHILNQKNFERIRNETKYGEDTCGFYSSTYFHIFINKETPEKHIRSTDSILRTLCHEIWHSISYLELSINEDELSYRPSRMGFRINESYSYFEESVVQISTMQTIKHAWKRSNLLRDLAKKAYLKVPYKAGVIALDAVLEELELRTNNTYKDLLGTLQKDLIFGTSLFLERVKSELGPKSLNELTNIDIIQDLTSNNNMHTLLKKLGALKSAKNWRNSDNGKGYVYLTKL